LALICLRQPQGRSGATAEFTSTSREEEKCALC
jgi:hypothetical protein